MISFYTDSSRMWAHRPTLKGRHLLQNIREMNRHRFYFTSPQGLQTRRAGEHMAEYPMGGGFGGVQSHQASPLCLGTVGQRSSTAGPTKGYFGSETYVLKQARTVLCVATIKTRFFFKFGDPGRWVGPSEAPKKMLEPRIEPKVGPLDPPPPRGCLQPGGRVVRPPQKTSDPDSPAAGLHLPRGHPLRHQRLFPQLRRRQPPRGPRGGEGPAGEMLPGSSACVCFFYFRQIFPVADVGLGLMVTVGHSPRR